MIGSIAEEFTEEFVSQGRADEGQGLEVIVSVDRSGDLFFAAETMKENSGFTGLVANIVDSKANETARLAASLI